MDALQDQLRLRARRWGALLDGTPAGDLRRSPLRIKLLEDAWAAFRAQPLPDSPVGARRALTAALRGAWLAAKNEAATTDDPFGALHLGRLRRLAELEAGLEGDRVLAWDRVLTAAELRPSAVPDVGRALRCASLYQTSALDLDDLAATRARAAAGHPGPWLLRQGVRTAEALVARFPALVEEALIYTAPLEEAKRRIETAVANLRNWDGVLARIHARLAAKRDGEEAAQAVVARFLEPRTIAAYATLPVEEIERVALVAGRHLIIDTLVGPQPMETPTELPEAAPGPEAVLADREQWSRLFTAIERALAEGRLTPQEVVFLWLAPALGAGEAWRISGGDLGKVGSANYHHQRGMDRLHALVGAQAPWQRSPNPGRPDTQTRGIVGLLAMRDGPDPFLEALAQVPADARVQAPPPSDAELLALMRLFNLGGPQPGAGALVARCLRIQRWDEARRGALATVLARVGGEPAVGGLDARTVAFLLSSMVLGLPGEATRVVQDSDGGEDWEALVRRWVGAEGPAHEVIELLRQLPWPVPAPAVAPPSRPVEREARLRQHLRGLLPSERLQSEARVPPVAGRTQCEASRASRPPGQLPHPKDEATH